MSSPLISIIVPVYNIEKYLYKCVDSILSQTYNNLEIILIDDGSTDNSGNICDEYIEKDSRITVVHKENGGLGDARNCGLDIAKGEYIGFVDSDDYIEKDMYEYLLGIILKEDADVAMCGLFDCYLNKKIVRNTGDYYKVTNSVEAIRCVMEAKITSVSVVNKLYKKQLFKEIRFRKGKTAEDAFIMIDLLSLSKRIVITNKQKYYYYHRLNSITTTAISDKDFDIIEAYEYNAKRVLEISPSLADVAKLRQCWARFYVLDKMMLSDGSYDKTREQECIHFLKNNMSFILKSDVFTTNRKIAVVLLRINNKLYKRIVRYNSKKNRQINE